MGETAPPGRRATLRDVAKLAGVSMMSVSNVVNGRFGSMTAETRARIESAITALDYRPHVGAQGLRRGRRFSLALLIIDRSPTYLAEPWMTDLVAGITNFLLGRSYGLYIQGTDPQTMSKSSLLRHAATDGLCVLLSGPPKIRATTLKRILATHQPVVLFQEVLSTAPPDVCILRQDDRGGALALARLLLQAQPRRIAMLTTDWEWPSLVQRELGIRDAIAEVGSPTALDLVSCGDGDFLPTTSALGRYISDRGVPDAIFAGSDPMGVAAIRHLRAIGVRVPDDVVVTGFGAFDVAHYSDPILTTVRSPAYELGAMGASALLNRLETGRFDAREIVLPVEIRSGGSTRAAAEEKVHPPRATVGKQGSAKASRGRLSAS